jgi:DNA-binding response OmpR family regulator
MTDGEAPVVLVVEDDPTIRATILRCLRGFGFDARSSVDRAEILGQVAAGACAAILLDLGLPDDDGIEIARAIRGTSAIPILMLTGRARISERVAGLEAGADDYIVKPFAEDELVARLRAVLRRAPRPAASPAGGGSYRIGDVVIAFEARELAGPRGRERLTAQELRLLRALIDGGGTLGRSAAYRFVFQRDWQPTDRALDVHVANLRRKLVRAGGASGAIVTLRGQGYLLRGAVAVDKSAAG